MRSFITAIIIFILVTVGVAANGVYVHSVSDELTSEAHALSTDIEKADTCRIKKLWDDNSGKLCITISHIEADAIEDTLTDIECRIATADDDGYLSARGRLIELCELLHDSETLSFDRIL